MGAEQISLGGQNLTTPALLTASVPQGTPTGAKVYVYLETTLPDDTGAIVPVWQEVDVGVVGADHLVRTGTLPYQGILSEGVYVFAVANDPTQVAQVRLTLNPSSFAGAVGARYAMVDPFDFNPVVSVIGGIFSFVQLVTTFTLDMLLGPHPVQIEAIPRIGSPPPLTTIQIDVISGINEVNAAIPPLPSDSNAPLLTSAAFDPTSGQIRLFGTRLGAPSDPFQVTFHVGDNDFTVSGTYANGGAEIDATVPAQVALGTASIQLTRTLPDGSTVTSGDVSISPVHFYAFSAMLGGQGIGVFDQATIPRANDSSQYVANINVGGSASYLAATKDNTRAYAVVGSSIAVVDAIARES